AEEVASGKRGQYPFDEKGKKALLEALKTAGQDIDSLQKAGRLSTTEAELLKLDLARLTTGVGEKRPTEMRMATCYEPLSMDFRTRPAMQRLAKRVALLEKLAKSGRLQSQVLAKILPAMEADIALIDEPREQAPLGSDAPEAKRTVQASREQVEKIRARLAGYSKPLAKTEEWGIVMAYWRHAAPLAESGKSRTAERKQVAENLKTAAGALDKLVKDGLLTAAEGGLLHSEMSRIRQQVHRNPPTDSMVSCYDMGVLPPAQASLTRLEGRLGLLKSVAASGKVQPEAIRKVLPSIRADLKTLADPAKLKELREPEREKAAKLAAEARQALQRIEAILSESK
ncbi:MAG TPA: hypothetical protein VNA25_18145, partial [Phycisphaerae bacterium]|nr:hypothetical protein [Phycisphaerae bacterium]